VPEIAACKDDNASQKCQDLQAEHMNMRFELIVLMMILSWMWDLPIALYL
jgi:hypothetical protein